jgi:lysophospholipase L1-like esterase
VNQRKVNCYVAMGDSFTAGIGEEDGPIWCELVASRLRETNADLRFRNLAVNGATSADVAEQVNTALTFEPDLVTVICGMNDVLKSVRLDPEGFAMRLAATFDRLQAELPNAAILSATAPGNMAINLPLRPRTKAHVINGVQTLNRTIVMLAGERRIPTLRWAEHPGLRDPDNFGPDGIHPSARGHALMADEVVRGLLREFAIDVGER